MKKETASTPAPRYPLLLIGIYADPVRLEFLKLLSKVSVVVSVYGYGVLLTLRLFYGLWEPVELLLSAGIPFVIVTVLRAKINAPRPYELIPFTDKPPKDKKGKSFPSRHVFSAFVIATETAFLYPVFGAVLFAFAVLLAVTRVLLGIHFLRDVVAGGLIGIVSGVVGMIVFHIVF